MKLRGVPGGGPAGSCGLEAIEVGLLELALEQSMLLCLLMVLLLLMMVKHLLLDVLELLLVVA